MGRGRIEAVDLANTGAQYYAPATVAPSGSRIIQVSGLPGATKHGHVPADYESQIHLALLHLRKLLIVAGAAVSDITKLTVLIVNYDPAQRKHTKPLQRFLSGHRPAITLIPVTQLAVPTWLFEIDATVALPATPPIPSPLSPDTSSAPASSENTDVLIIGAGLAGLTAALDLQRQGVSCIVVEARDRVGGKTWSPSLSSGDGVVDFGAGWLNDVNQTKVFALAKKYGAEILEQNTSGRCVLEDEQGRISTFPYGELPEFDPESQRDVARIRDMCEAECQKLDVNRPHNTELDSLTFEAFLQSRGASPNALRTANVWTRAMLGQEPSDISALYFLNYCKSGGGLLQMRSDRKGGGQHLRIRQGTQLMSLGMADDLSSGSLRLSRVVTAITQKAPREVEVTVKDVTTRAISTITARKVITTIPSPALRSIDFTPRLPAAKQLWVDSTTFGYYTKAMMVFRTPFWVDKGYCGLIQSFTGPAAVIRDTCSEADNKYVLTCFVSGEAGRKWASLAKKEREQALITQIGRLYGSEAEARRDFVEMMAYEWVHDEYAGFGCPCTALPPGVLDTVGGDALREACGDVHFAGTETAGEWKGYLEGAVRTGERAAAEVLKTLDGARARL